MRARKLFTLSLHHLKGGKQVNMYSLAVTVRCFYNNSHNKTIVSCATLYTHVAADVTVESQIFSESKKQHNGLRCKKCFYLLCKDKVIIMF